jgi:hypothetical protein
MGEKRTGAHACTGRLLALQDAIDTGGRFPELVDPIRRTPMSALGQKRTFRSAIGMSALPPIATLIAFFGVSALGQKRTFTN